MPSAGWTSSQRPASVESSSLRTGLASSPTRTRMRPRGATGSRARGPPAPIAPRAVLHVEEGRVAVGVPRLPREGAQAALVDLAAEGDRRRGAGRGALGGPALPE